MWWKTDSDKAKDFLQKSIKFASNSLEDNDKTDLTVKLKNFQKTLQIVSGLDEKSGQILLEKFIKATSDKLNKNEQTADSLVVIALQIVEKNPASAFQLGLKSLNFGSPIQIVRLIGELNIADAKLSEQLFLAALNNAGKNYNARFISRLSVTAFTDYRGKSQSDGSRRAYLNVLAEVISRAFTNEAEKKSACEFSVIASPIVEKFVQYLPEQSQTIRQQIQLCQVFLPKSNSDLIDSELKNKVDSVEDLIDSAKKATDSRLKTTYYYKAFVQLEKEEKFDEILSVLNSITNDEKEILGKDSLGNGFWDGWYSEYASSAAKQYLEKKDLAGVDRIINQAEKKIRPSIRLNLIYSFSPDEFKANEAKTFILENLEETRKELSSSDVFVVNRAGYFLALTDLYVKVQPTEAEGVFRETVKSINATDSENPDNLPEKDYAPLKDYVSLPSELLKINEISIFTSLDNISSRISRSRLKLGLLESSLVNYSIEKKKLESENKKASK